MPSKMTRGVLPLLTALAAVPILALPANARVSAPAGAAPPASSTQWWLSSLNVRQAWEAAPEQGAGVTVAVLSTGESTGLSTGARPGQPDPAESVIASVVPRARIMPVAVTRQPLPDAIEYAVSHGAEVIDLPGSIGDGTAWQTAVRDALSHDVVLAAPAGGKQPYATLTPPLTTPGSGLTVAAPSGRPVPDGKKGTMPAASLASALAAGVAALTRSRYPKLTAAQITQAVQHGAAPADPGGTGTGPATLNASGTVTSAASTFALIGNGMPNPAPAWNDYVTKRGKPKADPGPALWYAAAGAGALVALALVSVPILLLVRRRRRRPEPGARRAGTRQLRPARPETGQPGTARPETDAPGPPGPVPSGTDYAAARAAVASALVSRNRAIRSPQEVPSGPRNIVPTRDLSPRLSRNLRRGGP